MTEKIIARGRYEHRESGIANGVHEHWTQTKNASGIETRITFNASGGYQVQATATVTDGRLVKLDYYYADGVSGTYRLSDRHLHVERVFAGNTRLQDDITLPENSLLDLPFLSTKGHTILALLKREMLPIFAPLLRTGDRAGDLAKQSVQPLADTTLSLNAVSYEVRHVRYQREYWLDEHGMVLRALDDDYEMILTEYER